MIETMFEDIVVPEGAIVNTKENTIHTDKYFVGKMVEIDFTKNQFRYNGEKMKIETLPFNPNSPIKIGNTIDYDMALEFDNAIFESMFQTTVLELRAETHDFSKNMYLLNFVHTLAQKENTPPSNDLATSIELLLLDI